MEITKEPKAAPVLRLHMEVDGWHGGMTPLRVSRGCGVVAHIGLSVGINE